MTPTQIAVTIAVGVGPTALCLALFGWLVWLDRPARVTQQQPPAVVVPDDLTSLADVLEIDPPTTRLYVVPDPANMLPGLVQVGTAMVHQGCVADRRDGRTVRNCCAPLLARSATEVQW